MSITNTTAAVLFALIVLPLLSLGLAACGPTVTPSTPSGGGTGGSGGDTGGGGTGASAGAGGGSSCEEYCGDIPAHELQVQCSSLYGQLLRQCDPEHVPSKCHLLPTNHPPVCAANGRISYPYCCDSDLE